MAGFLNLNIGRKNKVYREIRNPCDQFTDYELYQRFRFDNNTISFITELIRADLEKQTGRSRSIPPKIMVMIALRYYASNALQNVVADSFGVSQMAVSTAVTKVTNALCNLIPTFVRFPVALEDRQRSFHEFYKKASFPKVLGCVDGTHFRILAPLEREGDYVNRKRYHSMNVMAVCDWKGKITNIFAKYPGKDWNGLKCRWYC